MKVVFFLILLLICWVGMAAPTYKHILPYGFLEVPSDAISDRLRNELSQTARYVGRIELRTIKDIDDIKSGTMIASGTGYVVSPGNVVYTSSHVIQLWLRNKDRISIAIRLDGQSPIAIEKMLSDDHEKDIASLSLPKTVDSPLTITKTSSEFEGARVAVLGYPLAVDKQMVTFGRVIKIEGSIFFLSNPSLPGCSGSPVILIDGQGKLKSVVGTLRGIESVSNFEDLKGAISIDYLTYDAINNHLNRLMSVREVKKTLQIEKDQAGQFASKIISGFMMPQGDPAYFTGMWNFDLNRADDAVNEFAKWQGSVRRQMKFVKDNIRDLSEPQIRAELHRCNSVNLSYLKSTTKIPRVLFDS
ncbi:MAG: trypsin-like peptidase domain-containing protein, partial [Deltaproteobacteria bacterium]|nr:trypsin-like peptidase domain-containing protein [Deltaproteobacteria bacterium]